MGFEAVIRFVYDLGSDLPTLKAYFYLLATAPVFILSLAAYGFFLIFIIFLVFLGAPGGGFFNDFFLSLKILAGIFATIFVWRYFHRRPTKLPLHKIGSRRNEKDRFGAKAFFLGRLRRDGLNIPAGYAFAVAKNTALGKAIKRHAHFISMKMASANVIVRSSFRVENQEGISFPGVFQSIGPVRAVNEKAVAEAMETVLKSRDGSFAKNIYGKDLCENDSLSFVVQEFMEMQWSGFGRSTDTLTGRSDCFLVEISQGDGTTLRFSQISKRWKLLSGEYESWPEAMTAEIAKLIEQVSVILNAPVEIEWGWKDGTLYLFQARSLPNNTELETWFIPDDMGLDANLTPMSMSVFGDEKDFQEIIAGVFGRLGLLKPKELVRNMDCRYYVSWQEYQKANRRLKSGRPPFRSLLRLLKILLASPKAHEYDYDTTGHSLSALISILREEIELQQDNRMRADIIAAWVEIISAGVVEADRLSVIFPIGQRHPLRIIGRDIHRALTSGEENSLIEKYGFLSRHDWEISKENAKEDISIFHDFRLMETSDNARNDNNWHETKSKIKANEKYALVKIRTLLVRFLGQLFRKEGLKAEIRHLSILKINAEIRRSVIELGRQKGINKDDVFYLKLPELLTDKIDVNILKERKVEYEKLVAQSVNKILHMKNGITVRMDGQNRDKKADDIWFGLGYGQVVHEGIMHLPSDMIGETSDSIIIIPDMKSHHLGILKHGRPFVALKGGILNHLASLAREIDVPFIVLETSDDNPPTPGMRVKIDFAQGIIKRA